MTKDLLAKFNITLEPWKKYSVAVITGLCLLMVMTTSCDVKTGKNDKREETKWSWPKNPTVYLKLSIDWDTVGTDFMMSFISHHATWATFSGTITKIYCEGTVSSTFDYSPTFYPEGMTSDELMKGFNLPQPYEFKFENDEDCLQLIARIKYFFDKADYTYESMEITKAIRYKDLHYDYTINSYYISINIDEGMVYVRVMKWRARNIPVDIRRWLIIFVVKPYLEPPGAQKNSGKPMNRKIAFIFLSLPVFPVAREFEIILPWNSIWINGNWIIERPTV
jgi:hypothetical protein